METPLPGLYRARRGADALESAGLRRGRPAVIENFKPTYIDQEKEKENNGLLPVLPGKSPEVDGAPGAAASHQSNGFVGNGAAGGGKEARGGFPDGGGMSQGGEEGGCVGDSMGQLLSRLSP